MKIVYNGKADSCMFKEMIGQTVDEIMKQDDRVIWLDADLMGCSGTVKQFHKNSRYVNCGIAEANMIGVATGLSAAGLKPYVHTFAAFASRRCIDQVFLSAGYANNPITVVATDPGITATFNGATHMPFEDIALYRVIPNATIVDVTDVPMLRAFLKMAKDLPGVKYVRVPRKTSFQVYEDDSEFTVGKGNVVKEGSDAVVIASGIMVKKALDAANKLEAEGIHVAVIDPFTIKPLDEELILRYAEKAKNVVVAENHNRIGGLTSAVEHVLVGRPCNFGYVAVEDSFGEVGPQDYLHERFGLTDEHIMNLIHKFVK